MIKPYKFNWGALIEITIPPEDILPERPAPVELPEIDPPNWAVKASSKLGGRRHPKREIVHTPWRGMGAYSGTGAYTPASTAQAAQQADNDAIYKRALKRRNEKHAKQVKEIEPNPLKVVPKGNLPEDAYRFWRGCTYEQFGAQCRWCNHFANSRAALRLHHEDTECKDTLLQLYRYAKQTKQRYCFVCSKETREERWGIPLCKTAACIGRWKFSYKYYLLGMLQYIRWALDAHKRDPVGGPFACITEGTLKYGEIPHSPPYD